MAYSGPSTRSGSPLDYDEFEDGSLRYLSAAPRGQEPLRECGDPLSVPWLRVDSRSDA
jgi:hypothetical protein